MHSRDHLLWRIPSSPWAIRHSCHNVNAQPTAVLLVRKKYCNTNTCCYHSHTDVNSPANNPIMSLQGDNVEKIINFKAHSLLLLSFIGSSMQPCACSVFMKKNCELTDGILVYRSYFSLNPTFRLDWSHGYQIKVLMNSRLFLEFQPLSRIRSVRFLFLFCSKELSSESWIKGTIDVIWLYKIFF